MKSIGLLLTLLAAPAVAQQMSPDQIALSRALAAVQAQRNQALDIAAAQQARAEGLADDLAKAQARVKELEKPADEKKSP